MIVRCALTVVVVSALAQSLCVAQEHKEPHPQGKKLPAFERFKQIAGNWEGKEVEGRVGTVVRASYRVTAGGTAVVETLFPGSDMEMVTVIHPDGDNLLLTHYCMAGNQPQMKADALAGGNKVAFTFVRATNLQSANAMHMHDVTFTFVDKDTLRSEWINYKEGKPADKVVFELKRKD